MNPYFVTDEERLAIIDDYLVGRLTIRQIATKRGRGVSTVQILVHNLNIARPRQEANRIHTLREDAFDVLTPEAAYWVGMLMADGSVMLAKGWSPRVRLGLKQGDAAHVQAFREFLGASHKINLRDDRQKRKIPGTKMAALTVSSQKLADALFRHGVKPNKTWDACASAELEHDRDFWRGVIDGDGWLTWGKDRSPTLGLIGAEPLMRQWSGFVALVTGCSAPKVYTSVNVFRVTFSGARAVEVTKTLYGDAAVALCRKAAIAREFMVWRSVSGRRRYCF